MKVQDWREQLSRDLEGMRKLAVLGIGNELFLDDGAGVVLARKLSRAGLSADRMQAFEASTAPENFTGSVRKMSPSHVLMVDAADLNLAPGSIKMIDPGEIGGVAFSTHTLPLKVVADYIEKEGCRVAILGIQPRQVAFGEGLSPEVAGAVEQVAQFIKQMLADG